MKERIISKKKSKIKKYIILTCVLVVITVASFIFYYQWFKPRKTYTVVNGYVEKISETNGILIKDEKIIEMDNKNSAIPIIEQDKRVAKDETIAIYKNDKYDEYLKQIESIDNDIQTLVKDLPIIYSVEIASIDSQISSLAKEAVGANSYLKMQEYKTKMDELSYKKIVILGELSPAGSKIREIVEKREEIEKNSKNSSSNIKSPLSGVVSYKIDELENVATVSNILKYTPQQFDTFFDKYSQSSKNQFGIKIINNFQAYFVIRIPIDENDTYIKLGNKYTIKTIDKNPLVFSGEIKRKIKSNDNYYIVFAVTNGIEDVVDIRSLTLNVIWNRQEGMAVLKEAIRRSGNDTYDYVTLVTGGRYVDIPIKIVSSSDNVCIVDNLNDEEKTALGIETNYVLSLYDVLVI
ncbi:MAG: HlyD family efflux transporter periplasmic adaptor subunit [Clostridia bacterium]|nr:HlyD family efflux transporter periplasmic adaptor subunit [Clostridia bacterium]